MLRVQDGGKADAAAILEQAGALVSPLCLDIMSRTYSDL